MSVIEDGLSGKTVRVDDFNRLRTFSTVESDATAASLSGGTYFIAHPIATLTTDSATDLIYVENTDSVPWVLNSVSLSVGASTGGVGSARTLFKANATGGTLITNGADVPAVNMNLGSPKPLEGVFKFNDTGLLQVESPAVIPGLGVGGERSTEFVGGPIVIAPGTNFTMGYTPPAGNTFLEIEYSIIIHREGVG